MHPCSEAFLDRINVCAYQNPYSTVREKLYEIQFRDHINDVASGLPLMTSPPSVSAIFFAKVDFPLQFSPMIPITMLILSL